MKTLLAIAFTLAFGGAAAQQPAGGTLRGVEVPSSSLRNSVEKSYRRMVRGMDLFERERAQLSPQGQLRFKVLPRKPGVSLDKLDMYVLGTTVEQPVPVAPDRTFTLDRIPKAIDENAVVSPDRKALTMTWRAEIRTPGLAAGTRRLGDMRLECRVGMEAGLVSNSPTWITRIFNAISETPGYCNEANNRYLFFADEPIFGVTLVHGDRRERLPMNKLYAAALDDPDLKNELPFCDCEVMLDRAHYLPTADPSWPDDTLVVYDYARAAAEASAAAPQGLQPGATRQADAQSRLGAPERVRFDSGDEVWVYREKDKDRRRRDARETPELALLFDREGVLRKAAERPAYPPARP